MNGKIFAICALHIMCLALAGGCTPKTDAPKVPSPVGPGTTSPTAPVVSPTPSPTPEAPIDKSPEVTREIIEETIAGSKCAKYSWKGNQGVMPIGYIKGIALQFARSLCNKTRDDVKAIRVAPRGDALKDFLNHYGLPAQEGDEAQLKTYTILFGLGVRESSGRFCCGRDMSADFSTAESAEAGLFQSSYGARGAHKSLPGLYQDWKNGKYKCDDIFKVGVNVAKACTPANPKNWGTGEGVSWQKLTKECPSFATEYAAVLVRYNGGSKGEFGPIRNKIVEYNLDCEDLLKRIQKMVETVPEVCKILQ